MDPNDTSNITHILGTKNNRNNRERSINAQNLNQSDSNFNMNDDFESVNIMQNNYDRNGNGGSNDQKKSKKKVLMKKKP